MGAASGASLAKPDCCVRNSLASRDKSRTRPRPCFRFNFLLKDPSALALTTYNCVCLKTYSNM